MRESFGLINPIVIKTDGDIITIKRAGKKVSLPKSEIKSVRAERRSIRGNCLVIETYNKPIYLKQSSGAVTDAMKYLTELVR